MIEKKEFDIEAVFAIDITNEDEKNKIIKRWAGGNFAGGSSKTDGTKLSAIEISKILNSVLGENSKAIPNLKQLSEE